MNAPVARSVSIVGCGFVADLYMRSLAKHPDIAVTQVFDRDPERLAAFCEHWKVRGVDSMARFLGNLPTGALVLNLTNPAEHYAVSKTCLESGHHVYSEKPLATEMDQAIELHELAAANGLLLASAPCSVLGEAAQTLAKAVRDDIAGPVRLVYAELDDGFIAQAPYKDWSSDSGAPWPADDEFAVGCTLEHAGYYLTWMIAMFGSVRRVVAASTEAISDKPVTGTPDFATATLFFESGVTARLTCSIVASHDHRIRLFGDKGVLQVKQSWDNDAPVKFHRRTTLRRRLIEHPFGKRIRVGGDTHPKVDRWGAAAMNFALGPAEMLDSLAQDRPCRLSADFGLHLTEVTLAMQNAGEDGCAQDMTTRCDPIAPMPWAT
ncbi:Gfo/Idh/MocA family protein [Shimia sp. Alg240-R146]|uniref:Gfo/Idh/MocA family protein n=1 Tax=Shimia sp. Alg240-R146 TaxID=2993449 RepID=UPI0022E0E62A|nr:Gfo/Idh/MocA family oxidoreductase [Shimia sp. Alg240-R146]